jgi:putative addiction module CopG family antidote
MNSITIRLPDPATEAFVEQLVSNGTYPSVSEYILALIREDRQRRSTSRLECLLLEGLEGEPTELKDADWDEMRQRYDERHAQGNVP